MKVSSNLLSRNFVQKDMQPSKYIQAQQTAASVQSNMRLRQLSIMAEGQAAISALPESQRDNYAAIMLEANKAANKVKREKDQSVSEESEKNLEDIKENIEEDTKEVLENTPDEGQPTENVDGAEGEEGKQAGETPEENPKDNGETAPSIPFIEDEAGIGNGEPEEALGSMENAENMETPKDAAVNPAIPGNAEDILEGMENAETSAETLARVAKEQAREKNSEQATGQAVAAEKNFSAPYAPASIRLDITV